VLLRYAHERYTQSRLYAGEHPAVLLDEFVDPDDATRTRDDA
jgi:hypothetical protein